MFFFRFVFATGVLAVLAATGCSTPFDGAPGAGVGSEELSVRRNEAYCLAIRDVQLSVGKLDGNTLSLTIENDGDAASQQALSAYPAIRLTFDPPVVEMPTSPDDGIQALIGSLKPGVARTFGLRIAPKAGVEPGTVVTVHAAAADNTAPFDHCASDGPEATGTITIGGV
jgi:hypothetical protein